MIELDRLLNRGDQPKAGERERLVSGVKFLPGGFRIGLGMNSKDLGGGNGHWTIHVDRALLEFSAFNQVVETSQDLLGSAHGKSRNDDQVSLCNQGRKPSAMIDVGVTQDNEINACGSRQLTPDELDCS